MKQILVLGSLNVDFVQRVSRMPVPGETLRGEDLATHVGGKGANQACAAALLGGRVSFAGMVGSDQFASRLQTELQAAGVDTTFVGTSPRSSGTALILVLLTGENVIVISPGANGDVSRDVALASVCHLQRGDLLLCQLEIPLDSVAAALRAAYAKGVVTMLDPAPACALPDDLLRSVSILTPNQSEAGLLCGRDQPIESMQDAEQAARELRRRGAGTVIVKMGSQGCLVSRQEAAIESPTFPSDVVDTTAAGDTFNGALAVALAEGMAFDRAVRFANAAAALSVRKAGAISSIPNRDAVDALLASGKEQEKAS